VISARASYIGANDKAVLVVPHRQELTLVLNGCHTTLMLEAGTWVLEKPRKKSFWEKLFSKKDYRYPVVFQ
jgi:hypothetical protein